MFLVKTHTDHWRSNANSVMRSSVTVRNHRGTVKIDVFQCHFNFFLFWGRRGETNLQLKAQSGHVLVSTANSYKMKCVQPTPFGILWMTGKSISLSAIQSIIVTDITICGTMGAAFIIERVWCEHRFNVGFTFLSPQASAKWSHTAK